MITTHQIISIPDVLGKHPHDVESAFTNLASISKGRQVSLDLSEIRWVCPYGVVMLAGICQTYWNSTGKSVKIERLNPEIHKYFHRIKFFQCLGDMAFINETLDPSLHYHRSEASNRVLDLVNIVRDEDIIEFGKNARRILEHWLQDSKQDIDNIITVLSESCSNIVEHSESSGIVTIQKYLHSEFVKVEIAVCDLGIGIQQSLTNRHGSIADSNAGYIRCALDGETARASKLGGNGLTAISRIALRSGGSLFIRSHSASVEVGNQGIIARESLVPFPGTQIAITFFSRLSG